MHELPLWALLLPDAASVPVLLIFCAVCFVAWPINKPRGAQQAYGDLLLNIKVGDNVVSHVSLLSAEKRHGKPVYRWEMAQIHSNDLPYFKMTDVPFTHILVRQRGNVEDLVTISVIERTTRFRKADFYWIRDATIGNRPGFPSELLLPHNFVLSYIGEGVQHSKRQQQAT
jgi:hypothetical protein